MCVKSRDAGVRPLHGESRDGWMCIVWRLGERLQKVKRGETEVEHSGRRCSEEIWAGWCTGGSGEGVEGHYHEKRLKSCIVIVLVRLCARLITVRSVPDKHTLNDTWHLTRWQPGTTCVSLLSFLVLSSLFFPLPLSWVPVCDLYLSPHPYKLHNRDVICVFLIVVIQDYCCSIILQDIVHTGRPNTRIF